MEVDDQMITFVSTLASILLIVGFSIQQFINKWWKMRNLSSIEKELLSNIFSAALHLYLNDIHERDLTEKLKVSSEIMKYIKERGV